MCSSFRLCCGSCSLCAASLTALTPDIALLSFFPALFLGGTLLTGARILDAHTCVVHATTDKELASERVQRWTSAHGACNSSYLLPFVVGSNTLAVLAAFNHHAVLYTTMKDDTDLPMCSQHISIQSFLLTTVTELRDHNSEGSKCTTPLPFQIEYRSQPSSIRFTPGSRASATASPRPLAALLAP